MDTREIQRRLLAQYGLRIEPEMSAYVARRLAAGADEAIPVMGGDARTGVPLRHLIDPATLSDDTAAGRAAV